MEQETDKPKKKRPFITIPELIIAVIVVLFVGVSFERIDLDPPVNARSVLEAEIRHFNDEIKVLPISQVASMIENKESKPTILFIYASWCSYCKKIMSYFVQFQNRGKLENFNLLFISLDENKDKLSKYILQYNYDKLFKPYMLEENGAMGLENMMLSKGASYGGVIPFTVIFDSKGRIISLMRGVVAKHHMSSEIDEAASLLQ